MADIIQEMDDLRQIKWQGHVIVGVTCCVIWVHIRCNGAFLLWNCIGSIGHLLGRKSLMDHVAADVVLFLAPWLDVEIIGIEEVRFADSSYWTGPIMNG